MTPGKQIISFRLSYWDDSAKHKHKTTKISFRAMVLLICTTVLPENVSNRDQQDRLFSKRDLQVAILNGCRHKLLSWKNIPVKIEPLRQYRDKRPSKLLIVVGRWISQAPSSLLIINSAQVFF